MTERNSLSEDMHTSLPLFEELSKKDVSTISDPELLQALRAMHVGDSTTGKVCALRHEVFDIPAFCSDTGLLHCPHSHAFTVIEEAIHRWADRGTIQKEQAQEKLLLLQALTTKLESMDMGAGFLEEEIDSHGKSGLDTIPAFLQMYDLRREEMTEGAPHNARVLLMKHIEPMQLQVALEIDKVRQWAIENAPEESAA